jgi:hypothetical protein
MNEGPQTRPFVTSRWCSTVMRTRDRGAKQAVSIHRPESFIHRQSGVPCADGGAGAPAFDRR